MDENEDNLSNKSMVVEIVSVETQVLKVTNECDLVTESAKNLDDFEGGVDNLKLVEENKGLIGVPEMQNLVTDVKDCGVTMEEERDTSLPVGGREVDNELSELEVTGVEAAEAEGLERKDAPGGEIDEIEANVIGDEIRGDVNDVSEGKACEIEVEAEGKNKLEAKDVCETGGDNMDDESEPKPLCAAEVEVKDELEAKVVVCEAATEGNVKGDMEEEEKLEVQVACEIVPESEMKDDLGVESEAGAVCKVEVKDELEAKVVCKAVNEEAKGDHKTESVAEAVCEAMNEEGEGDCETESVAEAVCEAVSDEPKTGCETQLAAKAVSEVDDEVKGKSETWTGTKLILESDKEDDAAVDEKVEMELVTSECLNETEEMAAKPMNNLEHSSCILSVAETAREDKNLVVETESREKNDEMESVPDFGDEEDEMEIAKEADDKVGVVPQSDDSQLAEDDERVAGDEEIPAADIEMETETDAGDSVKISGGKRKRGKNNKAAAKAQVRNMGLPVAEEDVCFVCFDGGDLVLCDRKNCPKAYHPSCVNRDEKFFKAKGRWNCGWHQCSHTNCQKNACYMCYTCTFSLCKGCTKDAVILCVRGNKGFCEACIKIVMMIEDTAQGNQAKIDFDDKSSWEFLFKDYWIDLKEKLSISPIEIANAKNPCKGSDVGAGKNESPGEQLDMKDDGGFGTDNASDNPEASRPKKRKYKKRPKSLAKQDELTGEAVAAGSESTPKSTEWASQELLEFVMHMKDGDRTVLSQFDVQALLLDYIKRNKLRDPRRKSQIICDARLENIFGKARVGHFEMLKLLESHFLIKDDTQIDDVQGSVVDTETNHMDADGNTESLTKSGKDRKRKTRKKYGQGRQSNLDDYAAIDIHNISLIYLRRKLMEDLLEDIETFNDKVVGTFVRIRISGSNQKQGIYRLVQVIGTNKVDDHYKVGKRTTNLMLEILNLNKTEVITIDSISNQEFTEDECKRLRQSIKCGLINRLTVGNILDKAMEVQVARVNDWLESEVQRLTHLCDRASDLGKKKQLRECVESLQLLRTPEERRRRLEDIPEIHADPKMDPNYESEDNDSEADSKKQEMYTRPRGSGFSRRGREPISPGSGDAKDSWSAGRKNSGKGWESDGNLSVQNFANEVENSPSIGISTDNSWNHGRGSETEKPNILEKPTSATSSEAFGLNRKSAARSDSFSYVQPQNSPASLTAPVATTAMNISETDKMWHYQDPHGKVQGPFSMVQLRKWSNTGYFPADLRIWTSSGNKDDSLLLTDALTGKFQKELPLVDNVIPQGNTLHNAHLASTHSGRPYGSSLHEGRKVQDAEVLNSDQNHVTLDLHINSASMNWSAPSVEVPVLSADRTNSNYSGRSNLVNLPSPTPIRSSAGEMGHPIAAVSLPGSNEALPSPAAVTPDSTRTSTLVSEKNLPSSLSAFDASPNPEQGNLSGSTNSLENSQLTAAAQLHGVQTLSHPFIARETDVNVVQSVTGQNPDLGTQGWGSAPAQSLEANSSIQASTQQPDYAQWGGVPSTPIQNPATNFPMQGVSQLPNHWRPPIQNNQSNIQPNVQWGMGIAQNSVPAQNLQPENPNSNWGSMQAIPNMGWVGPNPNMNWVASVQGPQPGNMNAGWVMSTGNPAAGFQGAVPGNLNPGWVAQPGNAGGIVQMLGPMNANQGWYPNMAPNAQGAVPWNGNAGLAAPTSNNVQGQMPGNANSGWSAPSGNANQGWGPPVGSQGHNKSQHHHNGDKFSGQKDQGSQRGRNWNKQSSFGGEGSRQGPRGICYIFQDTGRCRRGDSCIFRHST